MQGSSPVNALSRDVRMSSVAVDGNSTTFFGELALIVRLELARCRPQLSSIASYGPSDECVAVDGVVLLSAIFTSGQNLIIAPTLASYCLASPISVYAVHCFRVICSKHSAEKI